MKHCFKNIIFILLISLFSIILISCFDGPNIDDNFKSPGKGYIRISVNDESARTILPGTTKNDFGSYKLVFTKEACSHGASCPGTPNFSVNRTAADLSDPIHLEVHDYTVVVTAYIGTDSSTGPAALGESEPFTVSLSSPREVTVTLYAIGVPADPITITGTFSWDITFPYDVDTEMKKAEMEIIFLKDGTTAAVIDLLSNAYIDTGVNPKKSKGVNNSINSGFYTIVFTLEVDNTAVTSYAPPLVWHESLHLYQNMTSTFVYTFTSAHFYENKRTVTLHYNGVSGINIPEERNCLDGRTVTEPLSSTLNPPLYQLYEGTLTSVPANSGYTFSGWFKNNDSNLQFNFSDPVYADTEIYAQFTSDFKNTSGYEGENDFIKAIDYVKKNPFTNGYTLVLRDNAVASDIEDLRILGNTGSRKLTIFGDGTERKINLPLDENSNPLNGNLFLLTGSGTSLTIANFVTLEGSDNNTSLIKAEGGASFTMEAGSKITGNKSSADTLADGMGAAVLVTGVGSTFTMNGGNITGNKATENESTITAGLYADDKAIVNLTGGSINGNYINNGNTIERDVYIDQDIASFAMSGSSLIHTLTLNARSNEFFSSVNVSGLDVTGSQINLNLRGNENDNNRAVNIGYWIDNSVLYNASSASRFKLSNFISADNIIEPIIINYSLDQPGRIGLLTYTASTVTVQKVPGGAVVDFPDLTSALYAISESGTYTITVNNNEQYLAPFTLNKTGVHITIIGGYENTGVPSPSEIKLASNGTMFTVSGNNVSLTLGNNITLVGRTEDTANSITNNTNSLVRVNNRASFTMLAGSKITGNTSTATTAANGCGAAVHVTGANTTFTMDDGEISGNAALGSGSTILITAGLYAETNAVINLNNGTIKDNYVDTTNTEARDVYIAETVNLFTLSGNSSIGTLTLNFTTETPTGVDVINNPRFTPITINSWNGTVGALNLRGSNATLATVQSWWQNLKIFSCSNGCTTSADTYGKITVNHVVEPHAVTEFTRAVRDGFFFTSSTVGNKTPNTTHALDPEGILRVGYSFEYIFVFNIIDPNKTVTPLTLATWANGNIPTVTDEQWFSFIATASTQYIHATFGTMSYLNVQLYDSSGNTVGSQTTLYSGTRYTSRTLTIGQQYFIKVTSYLSYTGTYQIAFNTSTSTTSIGSGSSLSNLKLSRSATGAPNNASVTVVLPAHLNFNSVSWYHGSSTTPFATSSVLAAGTIKNATTTLQVSGVWNETRPYDRLGYQTITAEIITKTGALYTQSFTFEVVP